MSSAGRGLSAAELQLVVSELAPLVEGATVRDAAVLAARRDLLLFLETTPRRTLWLALGAERARIVAGSFRFGAEAFEPETLVHRLRQHLQGATLRELAAVPGDRRLRLRLDGRAGDGLVLHAELFGKPGNWLLVDRLGVILELAHKSQGKRVLEPGTHYAPPTAAGTPPPEEPSRFAPPDPATLAMSASIHAHFSAQDQEAAHRQRLVALRSRVQAACRRAEQKQQGLLAKLAEIDSVAALRQEADLLLANLHGLRRGLSEVVLPDVFQDGAPPRRIQLEPKLDGRQNASARFDRARRLEDALQVTEQRLGETRDELAALGALRQAVAGDVDEPELEALEQRARALGLVVRPGGAGKSPPAPKAKPKDKDLAGVRTFRSAEGYPILVGKSSAANDRLSMRVARGNDLWLHVGGGFAGSHVVVRLPKQKTASLETLLDAGQIAVHFSKARGAKTCEVLYTPRKFVRKQKGAPTGQVTVERGKTILIGSDPVRLRRVLDTLED